MYLILCICCNPTASHLSSCIFICCSHWQSFSKPPTPFLPSHSRHKNEFISLLPSSDYAWSPVSSLTKRPPALSCFKYINHLHNLFFTEFTYLTYAKSVKYLWVVVVPISLFLPHLCMDLSFMNLKLKDQLEWPFSEKEVSYFIVIVPMYNTTIPSI